MIKFALKCQFFYETASESIYVFQKPKLWICGHQNLSIFFSSIISLIQVVKYSNDNHVLEEKLDTNQKFFF